PDLTGLIFAGAMWDLRKTFVRTFATAAEGVRAADLLLYAALQRARDIPSAYFEILAADDDDGDIANGTPNFCAINEAFGAHGLADPRLSGPPVGAPMLDGLTVSLPRFERQVDCDAADVVDVRVEWRRRAKTELQGTMSATESPQGWSARLPTPPNNSVVQYRVVIDLDDGTALTFPDNAADPWYETYVGPTEDLYCIDFERNPFAEGWRSELVSGEAREGADDWQWGDTNGGESGDPATAFSGTNVLGNDLGEDRFNGAYQADIVNQVTSPPIDTRGFSVVRLQYRRWLNVEDADFDTATILANDQPVWSNFATGDNGDTHHQDRQWRFHDPTPERGAIHNRCDVSVSRRRPDWRL
ncbi:MAG: hypothetical protein AAGK78_13885, partial [Planctomycetota bacterium]